MKRRKILKDRGQDNRLGIPGLSPLSGFVPSERRAAANPDSFVLPSFLPLQSYSDKSLHFSFSGRSQTIQSPLMGKPWAALIARALPE